jgi:hypothetical protein
MLGTWAEPILRLVLQLVQSRIETAAREQLAMPSFLPDFALVHDEYSVCVFDGR